MRGMRVNANARTLPARRRSARVRPAFSTLAAMLALLLQVFAVQTHIDVPAAGALAVEGHVRSSVQQIATAPAEAQAACPLCQALASGATPLASDAKALLPPVREASAGGVAVTHLAHAAPAHPWQSRAPPLSL
jgi:hypothetical protein